MTRASVRAVRAIGGIAGAVVRSAADAAPPVPAGVTAPLTRGGRRARPRRAPLPVGPGTVVAGRYVVLDLLARGGMADVFRARDTDGRGGLVALKALRDADAVAAHRLDTEVRLLRRFEHRNVLRVHDAGYHAGRAFLVLELADGGTLATRLLDGPLGPDRVAALGAGLADALRYVHEHGVVHRDVTPANVLLDAAGRAMLGDFGIARANGATVVTDEGSITGTVSYLAPELLDGVEATPAADVYSLGLVLTECLTGERAFPGTPAEVALAKAGAAPVVPDSLPPVWSRLLRAMTRPDPARRPGAAEVHATLLGPVKAAPAGT